MAIHENLAVQYHQQDTNYYCGAACAQMVLQQIGAGLLGQDGLYNDNHNHSTIEAGWATAPDGLNWTLNNRKPASFGNYFVSFELGSEDALSRKAVWTIHHYQVAPVALVYHSQHWITVRGYQADKAPANSGDNTYAITSFDVNNPWPPTPAMAAEPPHSAGDGCSGAGRGIANENISYATWQSTYMTGAIGGHWDGKFVAVCDPEPPSERTGRQVRIEEAHNGEQLLSADMLRERAVAGLKRYGLYEREDWRKILSAVNPHKPVMVQRLDRRDEYYSITPMTDNNEQALALVANDARFGVYQQATQVSSGIDLRNYWRSQDELLKRLLERPIWLKEPEGRLVIRPESLCACPHLVWRPCRESLSPYWPFYLLSAGGQSIYMRVDGAIFTHLTLTAKGI